MPRLKEMPRLRGSLKLQRKRVTDRLRGRAIRQEESLLTADSSASMTAPVAPTPPTGWVEVRRRLRTGAIAFWTIFVFGLWMCCWPVSIFFPRAMRPIRSQLLRLWGWGCLRVMKMKLRVYGRPPKSPCFMVLNHISYVDIWVMSQQIGPVFVAKADMETWPIFGWFMSKTHQIFIKRESLRDSQRVLRLLNEVFDAQDNLVIFAEGRCSHGEEVLTFRPSLFQAAAERRLPVYYAALTYETPLHEPAPADSISWWRWEPMGDHFKRLLSLSESTATLYYGQAPVVSSDRKELARQTHAGCVELFAPLRQGVLEELPPPPGIPAHLFPEMKKHLN